MPGDADDDAPHAADLFVAAAQGAYHPGLRVPGLHDPAVAGRNHPPAVGHPPNVQVVSVPTLVEAHYPTDDPVVAGYELR